MVPPSDSTADDLLTSVIGHYKSDLNGLGTNVINLRDIDDYKTTHNVSKYILDVAYSDLGRYKYNHLVAAEFRWVKWNIIAGILNSGRNRKIDTEYVEPDFISLNSLNAVPNLKNSLSRLVFTAYLFPFNCSIFQQGGAWNQSYYFF